LGGVLRALAQPARPPAAVAAAHPLCRAPPLPAPNPRVPWSPRPRARRCCNPRAARPLRGLGALDGRHVADAYRLVSVPHHFICSGRGWEANPEPGDRSKATLPPLHISQLKLGGPRITDRRRPHLPTPPSRSLPPRAPRSSCPSASPLLPPPPPHHRHRRTIAVAAAVADDDPASPGRRV
jgi:hypothetical protein